MMPSVCRSRAGDVFLMIDRSEKVRAGQMGNSRFRFAVTIVVTAAALSSCTTTNGPRTGGLFSARAASGASASAAYIAALQGGIVSRSGLDLSNSEMQRALEAEYRALEAAPGGQPVAWSGQKVSGQVVAAAPYQVGQQNCRQYTHKLVENGRQIEVRGAACRNSSGSWTPLT